MVLGVDSLNPRRSRLDHPNENTEGTAGRRQSSQRQRPYGWRVRVLPHTGFFTGEKAALPCEGALLQARDLHRGNAHALGDDGLAHFLEEAQRDDLSVLTLMSELWDVTASDPQSAERPRTNEALCNKPLTRP